MAMFIFGTTFFSVISVVFALFLALWTYEDAKVKSEESPLLWVLLVLLVNPIGIIVYLLAGRVKKVPPPRKYKKLLIASLVLMIISIAPFVMGIVGYVQYENARINVTSEIISVE
jgi:hypothetical protein